jgi:Skp family chaperone for outer membrane proteins
MKKLNTDLLGWIVAATMAGILASSGFQGATDSSAVCDLQKVIKQSDLYKSEEAKFQSKLDSRRGLLSFINENRVIAADEWKTLKDLSIKDNPTDADKADLAKIKQTITEHSKKLLELQNSTNHTPEDANILVSYQNEVSMTQKSAQALNDEFSRELPDLQEKASKVVEDQARAATQAIGKEQGYSLVFDMLAAPYGAHDITDAVMVRMNKK